MGKKLKAGERTVVVIGGAGAMGRITVRDLVETAPDDLRIVVADYDEKAAKRLAKSFDKRKVRSMQVDVTKVRETSQALEGAFVVINSVHHRFNIQVMKAALAAGAHYMDLGGLFHWTREQLELDDKFKRRELTALLGVGAAPGVVNVLARSAADKMDEVHEIHCQVANIDRTAGRPPAAFETSYSVQTILEEASIPAAVFTRGELVFVEPMSGAEEVRFPDPVGLRRPACTLHSEVATLPLSYRDKGIRECTFKIAFSPELDQKLRFLRSVGLLSDQPIRVGMAEVVPRDVTVKVLSSLPRAAFEGVPDEYEIVRAIVRGKVGGVAVEEIVDCHVPGIPAWGFGVDVDTGCPPSIAAQMLARGEITERGAVPPERAIPAEPFFAELEKRGMKVIRSSATESRVESAAPAHA